MAHEISGIIMAGGRSRRMGNDKALVTYKGETLINKAIGLLSSFCNPIVISGDRNEYKRFGYPIVPDIYPDCGPIGGLHATLNHISTDWSFVLSVDAPCVNSRFIQFLINQLGNFDCIVPSHQNGIEPLIALYHKRTVYPFEAFIKDGDYKLQNVIPQMNSKLVNCHEWLEKYPDLFLNINTPDQLTR